MGPETPLMLKMNIKLKYIQPGLWKFGCLRVRRIKLGGYWVHGPLNFSNDGYVPKITQWIISFNNHRIDCALTLPNARRIAKYAIERSETYTKLSS